jgi:hypothetical protein
MQDTNTALVAIAGASFCILFLFAFMVFRALEEDRKMREYRKSRYTPARKKNTGVPEDAEVVE